MNKKELSKYYYLSLEIADLKDRIELLNETVIGSSKITGMPMVQNNESPIERQVERIIKLKNKLEKRKNEAISEMEKIENYIEKINDSDIKMIFIKRYLQFKKWDVIARELHMSESSVFRRHKKQLKHENKI